MTAGPAWQRVARMTDDQLVDLVDADIEALSDDELDLVEAAERELEQRTYAADEDERVREGTGNGPR